MTGTQLSLDERRQPVRHYEADRASRDRDVVPLREAGPDHHRECRGRARHLDPHLYIRITAD